MFSPVYAKISIVRGWIKLDSQENLPDLYSIR